MTYRVVSKMIRKGVGSVECSFSDSMDVTAKRKVQENYKMRSVVYVAEKF